MGLGILRVLVNLQAWRAQGKLLAGGVSMEV